VSRGSSRTTKSNHENTKKGKTRKKREVLKSLCLFSCLPDFVPSW
jgi:NADPH-dependent 7-cyano-7-deazaguanine reductase QueF